MEKGELTRAFTVKICDLYKLFELDVSIIRDALDAAEKYEMMKTQDEKRIKLEREYNR